MGENVRDIAATTVKGGFSIFLGNSIALVIDAVQVILVARMLTPDQYGIFTIALVIPNFFQLFLDWGLNQAIIRYIAQQRLVKNYKKIHNIIQVGIIARLIIGGFISLVLFVSADVFATVLLNKSEVGEYIKIASILALSNSIHLISASVFIGFEEMKYYAYTNIIRSLIKGIISPALVYLGFGVLGVVLGHTISTVLMALTAFILMLRLTGTEILREKSTTLFSDLKELLKYGLPLFVGNTILGFTPQFQGFLLSWFVSNEKIGNYGVANWFITLIGIITSSISLTLFPAFSKFKIEETPSSTKEIFIGSIRYSSMIIMPISCLLISVAKPLINTLFGLKYPLAPLYVSILLVPTLYVGLGSLSVYRFLNSQGETRTSMILVTASSIISILISFLFIWRWNIIGLLIGLMISKLIQNIIQLLFIKNKYEMVPDFNHTGKTLLCSLTTLSFTMLLQHVLSINIPLINLFISGASFVLIYIVLAPILGALNINDINNLDLMLINLKIIYPLARRILALEEQLITLRNKWNK